MYEGEEYDYNAWYEIMTGGFKMTCKVKRHQNV